MLAVMLLIPNPQKIRMALHAQRNPLVLPHSATLVVNDSDSADPQPVARPEENTPAAEASAAVAESRRERRIRTSVASSSSQQESKTRTESSSVPSNPVADVKPSSQAPEFPKVEPKPVQVASADPTASLGYMPAPTTALPLTTKDTAEIAGDLPVLPPTKTQEPNLIASSEKNSLSIPVPEPAEDESARKSASREETTPAEMAVTQTPALAPVKVTDVTPPPFPATLSPSKTTPEQAPKNEPSSVVNALAELSDDESISIVAASAPNRFHYRFDKSPLENVFKALAKQQGYTVILTNHVEGEYTGQMLDVDPAQAFAAIVKTHNYSVSRRGNLLLLSPKTKPAR